MEGKERGEGKREGRREHQTGITFLKEMKSRNKTEKKKGHLGLSPRDVKADMMVPLFQN